MLKTLRWKLTTLYLLAALILVALGGLGTYLLIDRYFQQTTDLALQYKMALEFGALGLPLPKELGIAKENWLQNNQELSNLIDAPVLSDHEEDDDYEDEDEHEWEEYKEGHAYNADLAAIFTRFLNSAGRSLSLPNTPAPPDVDSGDVLKELEHRGYDLRTIDIAGQGRIRILSYRTGAKIPAIMQTGRFLNDQDRVLEQYLFYLALLGGFLSILLAFISWILAGRSLGPAEKAWAQQQVFVSNASHELRTPLTFIRATADYSLRTYPSSEQREGMQNILDETDYMTNLVDDLLLLSRLDARRLKLNFSLIALPELFAEVIARIHHRAEEKEIALHKNGYTGNIYADATRIRQVLLILLDNALRFTPKGGVIELTAKKDGQFITITVSDTGEGIAPKHLTHLFERFYQVDSPENEKARSNGLGLSIAKTLIEAHDGSIKMKSELRKGTQAQIILPTPRKN
ncbi:MAG: HAMP domain-containing histidine kinase [Anaerolineae bacterium]|jgi:signal transduction histidine kinase|nr:HAMP domain-containing histidine kinase [Anaerolineae bacterium]MBT7073967.1 HAMP domain-containing histidine kinase [Anaerolineae bacterium]MBT7781849.1 HAMP domain-containing histidine kinase [Anaerolineae bacterium]